jgi:hypothetical protein
MQQLDASFDPVISDYFALHRAIERPAFVEPAPTPDPAMTSPLQRVVWSADAERRLAWISSLPDDWDGYGAAQIEHETVRRAWAFLRRIMPPDAPAPDIGPTKDGQLQFEWHRTTCDLEIRMRSSRDFAVAFDDLSEPKNSWDEVITATDFQRVLNAVREISERP